MPEFEIAANFHYSVKVPAEVFGGAPYSSKDTGGSITVKQTVEAASPEAASQFGEQLLPYLAQAVKSFVLNEAGLRGITDENGVIQPVITASVQAQPLPPRAAAPLGEDGSQVLGLAPLPQTAPAQPTATVTQIPTAQGGQPTWDGRPIQVYDNRQQAMTDPEFGRRPHINFKFLDVGDAAPANVKYKGFWPNNKDGSPSKQYQAALAIVEQFAGSDEAPFQ